MIRHSIYNTTILFLLTYLFGTVVVFFSGCTQNREEKTGVKKAIAPAIKQVKQIRKATYFLENSESMFGYVNGFTEYVDVISELAEKPQFVQENTIREFYFINGTGANIRQTYIGDNPSDLKNKLNPREFRVGDITKSDLNNMFQIAFDNAGGDSISVIISDCIYDIGQHDAPFNALATVGKETRSIFIKRLNNENIQTIIIKLHSKFKGDYFPTSKRGKIFLEQTRPYYILIFGEYDLMNKYFTEEYISKLSGYDAMARFFKTGNFDIPYQATAENIKGTFKFASSTPNKLIKVKQDRKGDGFQFSFAVDFSSIPLPNSDLQSIHNYTASDNFSIVEIAPTGKQIYGVQFNPTHLITVYADKSPYGKLEVSLNHKTPLWISDTDTDDESNIRNDTAQTFGFRFLTNAINEAYEYINQGNNITNFVFEITP